VIKGEFPCRDLRNRSNPNSHAAAAIDGFSNQPIDISDHGNAIAPVLALSRWSGVNTGQETWANANPSQDRNMERVAGRFEPPSGVVGRRMAQCYLAPFRQHQAQP
jgi:hypothetical protein